MIVLPKFIKNLLLVILFFCFSNTAVQAQCVQIESLLVAACGTPEGHNEMVRFKVGSTALNANNLTVEWPSNNGWINVVQNGVTSAKVAILNNNIILAGGCGSLLEPVGGVLPANATVILVTSYQFDTEANSFGALNEDIYIIFHNSIENSGYLTNNFGTTNVMRTVKIKFGASCSDTVIYNKTLLTGGFGGSVNFNPAGVPTYYNNGCSAPVQPFTVDAGPPTLTKCAGNVLNLTGTSQGTQSVQWTATEGSFSSPTALITTYTVPPTASGTITVTLTGTNTCGSTISDSILITVNPSVTPVFAINNNLCNGQAAPILPTTSDNGIVGTWSPTTVSNTASGTYLFTPNTSSCANTYTLNVTVGTETTVPTFNAVAPICNGETSAALPATSTNGITGVWSPALNNTATTIYTFTPNAGQCATTVTLTITVYSNVTPTFNAINPICEGDTIAPLPTTSNNGISGTWLPALNNSATTTYTFTPNAGQCATTTTLTIIVNANVTPTFAAVNPICEGETLAPLPTSSNNGITGTWAPALNNTATTTYTFTPNSGQCGTTTTLTITVNSGSVTPTFNAVAPVCQGTTLTALPSTSTNGISGTWSPALNNNATTTYTFLPNSGQCATDTTLTITVNPTVNPTFTAVAPICEGETLNPLPTSSTNGITGNWSPAVNNTLTTTYTFTPNTGQCATIATLTIVVNQIATPTFVSVNPICEGDNLAPLPTTSQNGITGTWAPALDNTTTSTYTFTPTLGQCATNTTLTIMVNNAGAVTPITGNSSVCIGEELQLSNATASGTWNSNNPNVATIDANGLVTPLSPGFAQIVYTTTSQCNASYFDITVYLPPNPLLTDQFICLDPITNNYLNSVNLQCGVSNADHTFEWTLNGQPLPTITNLHVATEIGLYTVNVTNNTTGCKAEASATVSESSIAIAEATVNEDFDKNQIITVTVTGGSGEYEYQLDNNWPQASNQFVVSQGIYTITIIDKNGCGIKVLTVFALNYPRYFTPNNDGYNDTWFIEGLSNQQEAQIFIFDRFGKLVKSIKPYLNEFWDGTLNGYTLPSTDYWFTLNYINKDGLNNEFKSHFSLKR
ncbi:T9SS type B sorting domain-containing protein [Flavobacterium antarcticum]|uniref:T9SS type B sorting domain-containing protein n=1 Tax=Flavobacterium antarcticum TaxID=271155 RepID=UPI0003B56FA6|nr:T9SS type B sorting domain-containing protein [Flavobacterium antarcticum]